MYILKLKFFFSKTAWSCSAGQAGPLATPLYLYIYMNSFCVSCLFRSHSEIANKIVQFFPGITESTWAGFQIVGTPPPNSKLIFGGFRMLFSVHGPVMNFGIILCDQFDLLLRYSCWLVNCHSGWIKWIWIELCMQVSLPLGLVRRGWKLEWAQCNQNLYILSSAKWAEDGGARSGKWRSFFKNLNNILLHIFLNFSGQCRVFSASNIYIKIHRP